MFKPPTNKPERGAPLRVPPQGGALHRTKSFLKENLNLDEDVRKIQAIRATIDVVLVPALSANFELTWCTGPNKNSGKLEGAGIREYELDTIYSTLPDRISARVLQYQYNYSAQQRDLEEYARDLLECVRSKRLNASDERRLLHFGAHSTGGLVVKKALLIAQQEEVFRPIFTSCFGVSFFGVPHRGSTILSDASFASGIKQELRLAHILPSSILRLLKPDSRELRQLNEDFKTKSRKLRKVWTFVEAEESTLEVRSPHTSLRGSSIGQMRTFVVDNRSSELHIGNESISEIGSNHRNLCKFIGARNTSALKRYKKELASTIQDLIHEDSQIHHSLPAEVHLFYQNELGGTEHHTTPRVKLLTAKSNFNTLIDKGPRHCLQERIDENVFNAPPPALTDETLVSGAGAQIPELQITIDEAEESEDDSVARQAGSDAGGKSLALPLDRTFSEDDSELTLRRRGTATSISGSVQSLDDPALRNKYFSWIHVPCNHPSWALDVLDRIIGDKKDEPNPNERLLNEHVLHSSHNLSHYGLPHSRRMRSQFKWLGTEPKSKQSGRKPDPNASLVIYLPYLHWDTINSMKMRSELIKYKRERSSQGKPPSWIKGLSSMEHQLLWKNPDGHGNLHIHQRRSLDQFGYPSLRDTTARDHDQVLYKRTKKLRQESQGYYFIQPHDTGDSTGTESPVDDEASKPQTLLQNRDNGKVLMVDQLWLFVTDRDTVVTFFSPKDAFGDHDASHNAGDLRNSIYNDVNGDPVFATQCHTPLEFSALTVLHAVTVLFDKVTDEELQVFDIFESYISLLTEEQTESFKRFRGKQERRARRRTAEFSNMTLEEEDNADEQEGNDTRDNIQDLQNLTELRDIEDELSTIGRLLEEQSEVVKAMHQSATQALSPEFGDRTQQLLKEARDAIWRYQKRVQGLKDQCKSAQAAYEFLLDMRDKQANIFEARRMRKSARVAEEQNRSIISFTIFTIIFLPLSFFTSLFGINAKEWSGNTANPALHQIFVLTFAISAAVIVVALLLAFNKIIRKYFFRFFGSPYRILGDYIESLKPARRDRRVRDALRTVVDPQDGFLWQLEPARHAGIERLTRRKTAQATEVALDP